ncbi:MAG: DNA recombination protein RmuC [Bacteroidetes bacterium]|nr:DNA recombination protein RmuC [Bacteroidota bacterium]
MTMMVYLILGLAIGFALGWFIRGSKSKDSGENVMQLQNRNAVLESESQAKSKLIAELNQKSEKDKEEIILLNSKNARLESDIKNSETRILEYKEEFEKNEKLLREKFENLANKILDEKTQKFTETNRTNLDIILNPLKEKIADFEKKVEQTYTNETRERHSLKDEVKNLVELNTKLNEEAKNLTQALKGEKKTQGNWGELMLERILESSGLRKGIEYEDQYSTTGDENQRLYPDFVIRLPENKHLIIDSKVSLVAYERYVNAENIEEQKKAINEHIVSVRNHINGLTAKEYFKAKGLNSPDFVLLFMPIESSFAAAIEADSDLFNYAWDRKIVIVSPSTLLATLKTVASLWRLENQNKNAEKIAEEAGSLYDKVNGFVEDLKKLGAQLNTVQGTYNDSFNKLYQGRGNILSKVEKLQLLGAKTSKTIDPNLLDIAKENAAESESEN